MDSKNQGIYHESIIKEHSNKPCTLNKSIIKERKECILLACQALP